MKATDKSFSSVSLFEELVVEPKRWVDPTGVRGVDPVVISHGPKDGPGLPKGRGPLSRPKDKK